MKRITAIVTALAVICGSAYLKASQARTSIVSAQQAAQARERQQSQEQMPLFHAQLLQQAATIQNHIDSPQVAKMQTVSELDTWYNLGNQQIDLLGSLGRSGKKGMSLDDEMAKYRDALSKKYDTRYQQLTGNGKKVKPSTRKATRMAAPSEQVYPVIPFDSSKR